MPLTPEAYERVDIYLMSIGIRQFELDLSAGPSLGHPRPFAGIRKLIEIMNEEG